MERVVVFIDGSNFYHSCVESLGTARIHIGKIANKLSGNRELKAIRYYNAAKIQHLEPDEYRDQQRFFAKIRQFDKLKLILGKLKVRSEKCTHCGKKTRYFVEKNTDVNIAIDIVDLAHKDAYDVAILVTGDGDFSGAVKLVRQFGKEVEHARFERNFSTELNQACNRQIILDDEYLEECFF